MRSFNLHSAPLTPFGRVIDRLSLFALQTALWLALALAFSALLVLAGAQDWIEALRFSAINWLPWVLLTPGVFWLTARFPLERGRLWASIPIHLAACVACTAALLWLTWTIAPPPDSFGPSGPRNERNGPWNRERTEPDFGPRDSERFGGDRMMDKGGPRSGNDDRFNGSKMGLGSRGGPGGPGGMMEDGPRGFGRDGGPGRNFSGKDTPGGMRGPMPDGAHGWFGPPFMATALRANFGFAIYLIVAAAAHALAFYRRVQERDRQALALTASLNQAKLDALRLQLQPHFLFNTLNAISTLVHRDADAADNLIADLSDLLRLSLLTGAHEVPLSRELELLDRYLAIEQTRLGDRLRVVREIEPGTLDALVPTFLLQPLVENAIRHGLEPRLAPGTITLSAKRDGDILRLAVTDDGVGLSAEQKTTRHGIGLANSLARLRALHGAGTHLELHALPAGNLRPGRRGNRKIGQRASVIVKSPNRFSDYRSDDLRFPAFGRIAESHLPHS